MLDDLTTNKIGRIGVAPDEYAELLPYLSLAERLEIETILSGIANPIWVPYDGPQAIALECKADELFYGGAAGGGKTDLLLGAGLTQHWRTIIFRREYAELKGIRERAEELFEPIGRFNGQQEIWRITEGEFKGARIEFGACQYVGDEKKFQGRPHDAKLFDEITQFAEAQYRFLITWNRTTRPGQRVRVIAAGNPPVSAEGRWVINYWGPWLDPRHPNPAKQGELRWFYTGVDGKDVETNGPDPVKITYEDGEEDLVYPKSRTFIRARVEDNPRLMETGYRRTLQNLPEPLRSRMLRGDFGVGEDDHEWQVIPTDWVLAAQARWKPTFEEFLAAQEVRRKENLPQENSAEPSESSKDTRGPTTAAPAADPGGPLVAARPGARLPLPELEIPASLLGLGKANTTVLTQQLVARKLQPIPETSEAFKARKEAAEKSSAVGVDVARGGKDDSIICDRLENWFPELITIPGKQTKDGKEIIQALIDLKLSHRRIQIDVTGVGTSPVDIGKMMGMDIVAMVMSEKSIKKDRSGKLGFFNKRAEWWWAMREALDPSLGDDIALPPDPGILADLTAPLWSLESRGIKVEAKEHVKERLGRSPDKGDAVVLSWAEPHLVAAAYLKYMEQEVAQQQALEQELREQRRAR